MHVCAYTCARIHIIHMLTNVCTAGAVTHDSRMRAHMSLTNKSKLVEARSRNCLLTFTPHLSRLSLSKHSRYYLIPTPSQWFAHTRMHMQSRLLLRGESPAAVVQQAPLPSAHHMCAHHNLWTLAWPARKGKICPVSYICIEHADSVHELAVTCSTHWPMLAPKLFLQLLKLIDLLLASPSCWWGNAWG